MGQGIFWRYSRDAASMQHPTVALYARGSLRRGCQWRIESNCKRFVYTEKIGPGAPLCVSMYEAHPKKSVPPEPDGRAGTSAEPMSSGAALQKCTQVLLLGSYTRCQKKLNSARSMRSR